MIINFSFISILLIEIYIFNFFLKKKAFQTIPTRPNENISIHLFPCISFLIILILIICGIHTLIIIISSSSLISSPSPSPSSLSSSSSLSSHHHHLIIIIIISSPSSHHLSSHPPRHRSVVAAGCGECGGRSAHRPRHRDERGVLALSRRLPDHTQHSRRPDLREIVLGGSRWK